MTGPIIFLLATGLLVGLLLGAGGASGEKVRWCLLIAPMAAILVGVPLGLLLPLLIEPTPERLLGFAGPWRGILAAALVGVLIGIWFVWINRNSKRRWSRREKLWPLLLFATIGAMLGAIWAASQWVVS